MRSLLATGLAIALATAAAAQAPPPAAATADLQGKLYRAAFSSGTGVLSPADLAGVAEPLRTRLATYLARRAAFKSRYKGTPDNIEKLRADAKRRVLERAIVSLIDTPGIEQTAAEFVAAAPIADKWDGIPDGPLAEAAYAEDALKKAPASPLAPWLYVFIAERQRVTFETFENTKNAEGMKTAARKYRAFAERARGAGDPVFAALFADMEGRPYLYIKSGSHPRDYDPDT